MKLYSGPLSNFGAKAEIALREKGIAFDLEMVPFTLRDRYSPKHPEVLRINPKGQVPVLVDGPVEIFDSTQIFEYLEDRHPRPRLWPQDAQARAEARLLELKSDEVLFPQVVVLMRAFVGTGETADAAVAAIEEYFADMDRRLSTREYLAGTFSYADIAFFLAQFFAAFLGATVSPSLHNLVAWRERTMARDAVRAVAEPMAAFIEENRLRMPDFMASKAAQAAS